MLAQDFIPGLTPPPTHPAVPEFLRRWTTHDPPLNTYQCLMDTRIKSSKMPDITCRICYPELSCAAVWRDATPRDPVEAKQGRYRAMPESLFGPETGEQPFARSTMAGKTASMGFRRRTPACGLDADFVAVATSGALAVPLSTYVGL